MNGSVRQTRRRFCARPRDRRGVLILVVLSLLIMFVVVAVMYVAVATRARSVATNYSSFERTGDTPEQITDSLARDLFRGSLNLNSPLRGTSLLEDIYGRSIRGTVATASTPVPATTPQGQGTLIRFTAVPGLSPIEDHYGGCVLTLISGANKGASFRILHSTETPVDSNIVQFTVMPIAAEQSQGTAIPAGSVFVINGHPFSGTGIGFNAGHAQGGGGPLDAMWQFTGSAQPVDLPYALLPNPAFFEPRDYPQMQDYLDYFDPAGPGGANEDYDGPDFQNPHLAFFGTATPQGMQNIKPSFHDPALLAYWQSWFRNRTPPPPAALFANVAQHPDPLAPILARKIMFRPNGYDHPQFVASGPRAGAGTLWDNIVAGNWNIGPWDVDNDGDSIADSIWIDPAYPVQVAKDGRTYKTLVAYLVLDLDGRLNLNAHGSIVPGVQYGGGGSRQGTPFDWPINLSQMTQPAQPVPVRFAGVTDDRQDIHLARGSGYGPADIRLDRLFRNASNPTLLNDFVKLLNGDANIGLTGRYGNDNFYEWDYSGNTPRVNTQYRSNNMAPGYTGDDPASRIREWDLPRNYSAAVSSYGSPPDLRGRVAMGLDITGQPIFHAFTANQRTGVNEYNSDWEYEKCDDPYELNLNDVTGRQGWTNYPNWVPGTTFGPNYPFQPDNPFSIQEMERLLRPFDMDTPSLPSRIVQLAPSIFQQGMRHLVTTHSFDLPVLSPLPPPGVRGDLANNSPPVSSSIIDLMNAKVSTSGGMGVTPQTVNDAITNLLAPELRRGLKMNINRPFGNGVDDDNDFIVDEDEEALSADTTPFGDNAVTLDPSYGIDVDFDSDYDGADGRQLFARHLYVLMMLLADDEFAFYPFGLEGNEIDNQNRRAEFRAHRLAQWAVNVVDFRDHDNIMTRFEYDETPFDDGAWNPNKVVYGCEMPVLLITETLAFHSRRVVDSAHDDGPGQKRDDMAGDMMTMGEPHLDQALIPRGSAFVELLALYNPNLPAQCSDLFMQAGGQWRLNLQKVTPGAPGSPVWRLAVSEFHTNAGMDPKEPVTDIANEHLDTVSFDPTLPTAQTERGFNLLPQYHPHRVRLERYVYFSHTPPPGIDAVRSYHTVGGHIAAPLSGEYVVVGPGGTGAGARVSQKVNGIPVGGREGADPHEPSSQLLTLRTGATFSAVETEFVYPGNAMIRPAHNLPVASSGTVLPIQAGNPPQPGASWGTDRVGFSISEPLFSRDYYPKPTELNNGTGLTEAYGDLSEGDPAKKFIDEPLDRRDGMPLKDTAAPPDSHFRGQRNADDNLLATGTYSNVRTVFLQRLADPTRAFNPQNNPYITVDWMPFDLTVFNGEDKWEQNETDYAKADWDPDDKDPNADHATGVVFTSRQRGRITSRDGGPIAGKTDYNIWAPISDDPLFVDPSWTTTGTGQPPTSMSTEHYFRHKLRHSLGYLNQSYGVPMTRTDLQGGGGGNASGNYIGWPKAHIAGQGEGKPFPWIKWNNRPFSSVHELLEVPASTPSRLCWEFSYSDPTPADPNVSLPTVNSYDPTPSVQNRREFRHLLNFFHSRRDQNVADPESADLYCVLDFLHVPSRFVGTETVLNPNVYSQTPPPVPPSTVSDTALFRPPFNLISNYRDPGRINLNTINDASVWKAVAPHKWDPMAPNAQGGMGDWVPEVTWQEFIESRRGDTNTTSLLAPVQRDPMTPIFLPTIMANPFRSGAAGDLVPQNDTNLEALKHDGVNVTLLRAKGDDPDGVIADKKPLFGSTTSDVAGSTDPLYTNNSRNSAFRYQNIERLSNLVTTRSNVYAVWVTVGYFEALPNPGGIDAGHPDGYQIGAEMGSDTGDVKRHRAFYIFDRSIPVGFERGMNHNIDRAIILKRFIE